MVRGSRSSVAELLHIYNHSERFGSFRSVCSAYCNQTCHCDLCVIFICWSMCMDCIWDEIAVFVCNAYPGIFYMSIN